MELQLKHLSCYLPYELQIYNSDANKNYTLVVHNSTVSMKGGFNINEVINNPLLKPILRPMSDYDKFESDFDLSTDFYTSYIASNGQLACGNSGNFTYLSDMITVTNWLFENHFDVFGLIPAGIAIDVNTIDHETEAK